MPLQIGSISPHDDGQHLGSAKKGIANGVAELDAGGKVPAAQLDLAGVIGTKDAANGYAGLDASTLLALAQQQLNFKIGSVIRDTSLASGNFAITGVGFQPRGVIILMCVIGTSQVSIGFFSATAKKCIINDHVTTAASWKANAGEVGILMQTSAIYTIIDFVSLDADGFTLNLSKVGAKTGDCEMYYMAFR